MARYIDDFYKSLRNGRCKGCEYAKCVTANSGFMFLGCYKNPYKGKYVGEIENCPKIMA